MKTLWARVGMRIDLTEEEYRTFVNNPTTDKLEILLKSGKMYMDGETYFPSDNVDNPSNQIEL